MKRDETTDTNSQTNENLNPDIVRVYWLWGVQEDERVCSVVPQKRQSWHSPGREKSKEHREINIQNQEKARIKVNNPETPTRIVSKHQPH